MGTGSDRRLPGSLQQNFKSEKIENPARETTFIFNKNPLS
jgi:hypothetical protein